MVKAAVQAGQEWRLGVPPSWVGGARRDGCLRWAVLVVDVESGVAVSREWPSCPIVVWSGRVEWVVEASVVREGVAAPADPWDAVVCASSGSRVEIVGGKKLVRV